MNILSRTILIILIFCFPKDVLSSQCGSLFFGANKNIDKVIELIAVDDNFVKHVDNYNKFKARKIIMGEYEYLLSPGRHSLQLRIWDKGLFENIHMPKMRSRVKKSILESYFQVYSGALNPLTNEYKKSINLLASYIQEVSLDVNISIDHTYQIDLSNFDNALIFTAKQKDNNECFSDKRLLYGKSTPKVFDSLTPELESRLKQLILTIQHYHKGKGTISQNLITAGYYQYFGAALSNKKGLTEGYRVLSVQPFSMAHRVGLLSGDYIMSLGADEVKGDYVNANQAIDNYLFSIIENNNDIDITIIRNDEVKRLKHKYIWELIPQTTYFIGDVSEENRSVLIQTSSLPKELLFEYDQVLLELKEYYKSELEASDIEIVRKLSRIEKYGFTGRLLNNQSDYSFLVSDIRLGSNAEKIGLLTGDIINLFDGHSIKGPQLPFSQIISSLITGQEYTVEISRNGQSMSLIGNYEIQYYPPFNLIIGSTRKSNVVGRKLFVNRLNITGPKLGSTLNKK